MPPAPIVRRPRPTPACRRTQVMNSLCASAYLNCGSSTEPSPLCKSASSGNASTGCGSCSRRRQMLAALLRQKQARATHPSRLLSRPEPSATPPWPQHLFSPRSSTRPSCRCAISSCGASATQPAQYLLGFGQALGSHERGWPGRPAHPVECGLQIARLAKFSLRSRQISGFFQRLAVSQHGSCASAAARAQPHASRNPARASVYRLPATAASAAQARASESCGCSPVGFKRVAVSRYIEA